MNMYMYLIPASVGLLASILIYPFFFKVTFFILLIILSIVLGLLTALWIHLVLSTPHKGTLGAENTLTQMESFRTKLMVLFHLMLSLILHH